MVARELKRNGSRTQGYRPRYADLQAHARRWSGSKLGRNTVLRESVLSRVKQGWSPEQVAGRLSLDAGRRVICHETIYGFIYAPVARKKGYSWRQYLPHGKSKRGRQGRSRKSPASYIRLRRPWAERPREADDRLTPGHWEADLTLFGNRGQSLMVLHERHSRLLLAAPKPSNSRGLSPAPCSGCWLTSQPSGAGRLPLATVRISPSTINCVSWEWRPFSAIHVRPGRREGRRTPSE